MKRIYNYILLLLLIVGTGYVMYSEHNAPYRKAEGTIFGTFYTVTYQSSEDLQPEILKALEAVDRSMSMFNEKSTVSLINRGETDKVDNLIDFLLPRALKVSERTAGAFDITVAPLCNVWGFGWKKNLWPTDAQIDSIRQFVGYQKLSLNDHRLSKSDARIQIDFSAIAKGYGVDRVAQMLDKAKVKNYMIYIGGEDRMRGVNEKGGKWRIGIEKPTEKGEQSQGYQKILEITDKAVATSGNYRNFFIRNGKKYAHTIDPRTGYPVQHDVISATIIADECWEADAYATACMVMGLEKAKQVLTADKKLGAYLIYIDKDGKQQVWEKQAE